MYRSYLKNTKRQRYSQYSNKQTTPIEHLTVQISHSLQSSENPQTTVSPFPRSTVIPQHALSSDSKFASPNPNIQIVVSNAHKSSPILNDSLKSHIIQHHSIILREEFHRIIETTLTKWGGCFKILVFQYQNKQNSTLNVVISTPLTRQVKQVTIRGIQFLSFTTVLLAYRVNRTGFFVRIPAF